MIYFQGVETFSRYLIKIKTRSAGLIPGLCNYKIKNPAIPRPLGFGGGGGLWLPTTAAFRVENSLSRQKSKFFFKRGTEARNDAVLTSMRRQIPARQAQ